MEKMLRVPVFAYNDIQGAHIAEAGADESGRYDRIIRALYSVLHDSEVIQHSILGAKCIRYLHFRDSCI